MRRKYRVRSCLILAWTRNKASVNYHWTPNFGCSSGGGVSGRNKRKFYFLRFHKIVCILQKPIPINSVFCLHLSLMIIRLGHPYIRFNDFIYLLFIYLSIVLLHFADKVSFDIGSFKSGKGKVVIML